MYEKLSFYYLFSGAKLVRKFEYSHDLIKKMPIIIRLFKELNFDTN